MDADFASSYAFPTNVDNTASANVVYNGTWTTGTGNTRCYFRTTSHSGTVGDDVNFTFTGNGVRLYGIKAGNYGKLNVSIDGGSGVVLGTISGTAVQVGVPVVVGITYQAETEAAGDGVISIRIRSSLHGINKYITFGSKCRCPSSPSTSSFALRFIRGNPERESQAGSSGAIHPS